VVRGGKVTTVMQRAAGAPPRASSIRMASATEKRKASAAEKENCDAEAEDCVPIADSIQWTPSARGEPGKTPRDLAFGPLKDYSSDPYLCTRRKTRTVEAGPVKFGSEHPLVRQTMATTLTSDVEGTIEQVIACADEGFDIVRVTVVGMRDAKACAEIRKGLDARGYSTPIVADMHFQPKVAMKVAEAIEKIRVNPGNFADGRKTFEEIVYETEEEYAEDRNYIAETFTPLVLKAKELNRAMRIGVNHGSLSARVLSFYGDSPRGMVESAIEFADICRAHDYHNFVFSMKASNPLVMVQGYRLLAAEMYRLGWDYPLHLGVTEAGEGEDGRMKSAIGIGALLADGLGDTIRVSLTEDPECEYAPCNRLAEIAEDRLSPASQQKEKDVLKYEDVRDFQSFSRRAGRLPAQREGDEFDYRGLLNRDGSVHTTVSVSMLAKPEQLYAELGCKIVVGLPFKDISTSDALYLEAPPALDDEVGRQTLKRLMDVAILPIIPAAALAAAPVDGAVALVTLEEALSGAVPECAGRMVVSLRGDETREDLAKLKGLDAEFLMMDPVPHLSRLHASRRLFAELAALELDHSVIHVYRPPSPDPSLPPQRATDGSLQDSTLSEFALQTGTQVGGLLVDGLGDGVLVVPPKDDAGNPEFEVGFLRNTSFGLLQGSRMRSTKTEFVSCPSCGRTLFDLQEVTAQISERTGHLPGVAIAIMGCIVNGPGEMADADFGYVGGAPGKVDLYVGKEVVKRGIPNEVACDALVDLIKENGRWKDKDDSPAEAEGAEAEEAAVPA
jgi:(E)-4-hydroxy-3-methylbut-2-enyl-diphosphate synthase